MREIANGVYVSQKTESIYQSAFDTLNKMASGGRHEYDNGKEYQQPKTDRLLSHMDSPSTENYKDTDYVKYWGQNNRFPNVFVDALRKSAISQGLLNFKKNVSVAGNWYTYEEVQEGEGTARRVLKVPILDMDIKRFFKKIDARKLLRTITQDWEYGKNIFVQIILTKDGTQVAHAKRLDFTRCRVSENKKYVYFYDEWYDIGKESAPVDSDNDVTKLKLYTEDRIEEILEKRPKDFVLQVRNDYFNNDFYGVPDGILGAYSWIVGLNEIPHLKYAFMLQGITLRYHIKINIEYFEKVYPPSEQNPSTGKPYTTQDWQQIEKQLFESIDKNLAGTDNAYKSIHSKFEYDINGKAKDYIIIESIKDEVKYDAFLEDLKMGMYQITSSANVDPSLAAITSQGQLSSGSEKQNGINIHILYHTQESRDSTLKVLNLIKELQFPDKEMIEVGIKDYFLVTSDIDKNKIVSQENEEKRPLEENQ